MNERLTNIGLSEYSRSMPEGVSEAPTSVDSESKLDSYERDLQDLLTNSYVLEQLKSDTPDFSWGEVNPGVAKNTPKDRAMKQLEDFIKGLSVYRSARNENPTITRFGEFLANTRSGIKESAYIGDDERVDTVTRRVVLTPIKVENVEISESSRRLLFEAALEKIISIPDAVPDEHYQAALGRDFETPTALGRLKAAARRGFEESFSIYIEELMSRREMAHDLNISFKFGEEYKKFIISGLRPEGIDFIHNDMAGVAVVMREYERFASDMLREKKEWFRPEEVVTIDENVRKVIENLHQAGLLKAKVEINETTTIERALTKWEVERALKLAKIIFRGTERMAIYAGTGQIPPDVDLYARISSIYDEYIVRDVVPEKVLVARFQTNPGQAAILKHSIEEIIKYDDPHNKYVGLFGLAPEAIVFADSGAPDPESHSWRQRQMFLANIQIVTDKGQMTLERFLGEKARDYKGRDKLHPIVATGSLKGKAKDDFCDDKAIRKAVLGQTMYLSVLARYGDFNHDLKTEIWKKIAIYSPSTIASLLAEKAVTSADEEIWKNLRIKLHIAEEARNRDETRKYENILTDDDLTREMNRFLNGGDDYKHQIEKYFREENGNAITDPEQAALLRKIIDIGYANAEELAAAKMPFSYCLTDIAKTSWDVNQSGQAGMQSADMIRLLSSDHQNIGESWGALGKVTESPASKEMPKHYTEAINSYAAVHGRKDAQKKFEPFLVALLKMSSTDPGKAFIKSTLQTVGIPTSEMEKYYEESKLSLGPTERNHLLDAIAQLGNISDDKINLEDGMTQLQRIKKKTKSELVHRMIELARTLMVMFGPVFAIEFLKTVMPSLK